MTNTLAVAKGL